MFLTIGSVWGLQLLLLALVASAMCLSIGFNTRASAFATWYLISSLQVELYLILKFQKVPTDLKPGPQPKRVSRRGRPRSPGALLLSLCSPLSLPLCRCLLAHASHETNIRGLNHSRGGLLVAARAAQRLHCGPGSSAFASPLCHRVAEDGPRMDDPRP